MKIKIFTKVNAEALESEINSFLSQNDIVFIDCKITSSENGLYVIIFYKKGDQK